MHSLKSVVRCRGMQYAVVNLDDIMASLLMAETVTADFSRPVWTLKRPTVAAVASTTINTAPYS